MKIIVCIKQVPDTETKMKLNNNSSAVEESSVGKWIISPYDEFAVEEALKIKDSQPQANICVISLGPKKRVQEALRTALAMGADEGVVIDAPELLEGTVTAHALSLAIKKEGEFDLIFTGKWAIDDNNSFVGASIAEHLQIPHVSVVSKITYQEKSLIAEREVEGGNREILELPKPCLIGANKGLNSPRYASLPGIMKAKKKPIKELSLSDLGLDPNKLPVPYIHFQLPAEKPPSRILKGELRDQVSELVKLLKDESKVL